MIKVDKRDEINFVTSIFFSWASIDAFFVFSHEVIADIFLIALFEINKKLNI